MTKVVRFPPLPAIPGPLESGPDERQQTFERIAGKVSASLFGEKGDVRAVNTSRGFRASAVDLGLLQDILSVAVAGLGMTEVRDRWNDDVSPWFREAIMTWVQRCKSIRFHLEDNGIRVELETQDDRGYYRL